MHGPPPDPRPPRPDWAELPLWEVRAARELMVLTVVLLGLWALFALQGILTPVLIALACAYLLTPLVERLHERWGLRRGVITAAVLTALGLALVGLWIWLGPLLYAQASELTERAPDYARTLLERAGLEGSEVDDIVEDAGDALSHDPLATLRPLATGVGVAFGVVGTVISATTFALINVLLFPVYLFLFTAHLYPAARRLAGYLPASRRERISGLVVEMDAILGAYVRGRVVIALIMAALFALGWSPLFCDVPYWLLIALLTGVLSLVPYASGAGWVLALVLKLVETAGPDGSGGLLLNLGGPTLVFLLVQALEGWILTPWIQGRSMQLRPLTVLIVVFVAGMLGGLIGLILAVPAAACVKVMLREARPRLREWAATH